MVDGRGPLVVLDVVVPEDVLVLRLADGGSAVVRIDAAPDWGATCGSAAAAHHRIDDGDDDRAGAAEGVRAAEQAARRLLLGAATSSPIDGNQGRTSSSAQVGEAIDAAGSGERTL
jgi:hypothetical protein